MRAVREAHNSSGHNPYGTLRYPLLPDPKDFAAQSESSWEGFIEAAIKKVDKRADKLDKRASKRTSRSRSRHTDFGM